MASRGRLRRLSAVSRGSNTGVIVGVLMVGALIVFALRSVSTETEVLPPVTLGDPQDGPAAAVVVGKHQSGGISILGLRFGRTTYRMSVQFFTAPGCIELVRFGDRWPTPFEECSSTVPIRGEISGGGTAATGESIINVDVEVPEDCYESVARGESWPPAAPACAHVPSS